jgi:hypothetical protein
LTGFDSDTPQQVPIGDVKAGQVIKLNIDYTTEDPDDQFEGEPLILLGSNGYKQTISTYGNQIVSFPISQDGETLSAYIQGADGDEQATISVSSAMPQIQINDTTTTIDNLTLFNPDSTALPYALTIPARVSNLSDTTQTYQLSVQNAGAGSVLLSQSSVTLAAGASTEITLTPTADSSFANDVHLIASNEGVPLAEDDMTVASVLFPRAIYNADTPAQMISGGFYRIPPRVATPIPVSVTPDLSGSGQSVTLLTNMPSADSGSALVDGQNTENLTRSTTVNLQGGTQTTPGHAAELSLLLDVNGRETIQSLGFSVAAIPQNYTETFAGPVTQANFGDGNGSVPARGLIVSDGWSSDSGVLADLDQAQLSEVVQNLPGAGAFLAPANDHVSSYLPAAQFTSDTHANSVAGLSAAVIAHGQSGTLQTLQTNQFRDARTGATDIPMTNSGYTLARTLYTVHGVVYLMTTKVGASTTADGISSAAGAGSASVTQVVENLPPGDPLVVTTQPPATLTAGQSFGLVVTVENANGSTNTAYNGAVSVASDDGVSLGGMKTANAVNGVATFSGLTETTAGIDALDVTGGALPQITTQSFTVNAAAATQLFFHVPPASGITTNSNFSVELQAVDTFGNVDPNFTGSITIGFSANPGGAMLGGALTLNAVNGQATFNNIAISKPGNGYVMQATAGGLATGVSAPFNVADQLVATTPPPDNVVIGAPFSLAISAEDGLGNVDTSFTGDVTLADNGGNPLTGILTVAAVNGVATFTGLRLTTPGADSLTVSSPGLPSRATATFTVGVAKAVKLAIEGPNGNGAGNIISSPFGLDVDAVDINGNVDPTFNGVITLALANNPGNSTLGGSLTAIAVNGAADFSGLTINNLANGYTLIASSSGLASGTSLPFDVTDQVVVATQPPELVAAGAPFGLVVSAEAGLGNIDTAYNGNVTIALSNYGSNNATLLGALTAPAVNGVAVFSGLTIPQAGSYGLVVSADGLAGSATNEIIVTSSSATRLALTPPPAITAGAGFGLTVTAEDASGNVDTHFTGSVTLALASGPAGGTLDGTVTVAAVAGVASFTGLTVNNAGAGYTIQATAEALTPATTNSFRVTAAGVANQLVITTQPPASITAGSAIGGLTVSAEDGFGTVVKSFAASVTLGLAANPGGAILHGTVTVTLSNGVATFNGLSIDQAAAGYTFIASSGSLATAISNPFAVTPAAATQLVVVGPTGNVLTGGAFSVQVNALDPFGNLDTNFSGAVNLSLASNPSAATLGGPLTVAAASGSASFPGLTLDQTGSGFALQATRAGLAAGTSSPFNVTKDQLVFTVQPPESVSLNPGFSFTISVLDGSGNIDTSFNGSIPITLVDFSGSGATLGGTLVATAVNGQAAATALVNRPGTFALAVSATGVAGTSSNPFTAIANATQLAVTAPPAASQTAGAPFALAIAAEDSSGNVDTSFNGNVTLSLAANPGGAALGGTLTMRAINGIASFPGLTLNKPANGYSIQAAGSGLTSVTINAINVAPAGVASQLVFTAPPGNVPAGSGFNVIVTAEDGTGATAARFNGVVTLALNNFSVNPTNQLGGTLTTTAVNGVATFLGLSLISAGNYSLSATASGLPIVASALFAVTPLAATQLAVATPGGDVLSGAPVSTNVQAEDAFGNVDPNFTGSVTLSLGANPGNSLLGGTLTATAVNGVASFAGLMINNPDPGYTLRAAAGGLPAGMSSPFTVTNDRLVITTPPPANVTPGVDFGLVVSAENGTGAVDSSFNGSVTLSLPPNTNDTLGGTVIVRAVNGVATFSGLTLTHGVPDMLIAASNGLAQATTGFFTVTPAADSVVLTMQPPAYVTAGAPFEIQFKPLDAFGNVDPNFQAGSLTIPTNPGNSTFGATITWSQSQGVYTVAGITLDNPGTGYVLQLHGPGSTTVDTNAFNVTPAGTATQWVITTQPPSHVSAGAGFGLLVKAEDSFGTIDTTFTGSVTLNDPSGALGGTLIVNAIGGIATFGGLTLSQAGNYLLSVSGSALAPATASLITVNGAPATSLAIIGPDSNVLPGSSFGLTVLAVDSNGNLDPHFTGPITLSLGANAAGGTLGGTITAAAVNGMATFTGLSIDKPAQGYSVTATSSAVTGDMPLDVNNDQLMVATPPPGSVSAGTPFGLVVSALNASGIVDATFNGSVTVGLINLAADSNTVLTMTTAAAVNGVATFSGLTIAQSGTYSFSISAGGVGGTTTNAIKVTAAVPAPSTAVPVLGRVVLPASVIVGAAFRARVPVVVTNGGSSLTGKFTINLYADLNTAFDGNQVLLAVLHPRLTLKGGKTHAFTFNLRSLPRTLAKGTYHLLVQVIDPTGASSLAATTQTIQLAAPTVILNVSPRAVLPSTIAVNKSGSIIVTITNTGNSVARGVLNLILSPSADGISPVPGITLAHLTQRVQIGIHRTAALRLHFKVTSATPAGTYFPYVSATLGGVSDAVVGNKQFTLG